MVFEGTQTVGHEARVGIRPNYGSSCTRRYYLPFLLQSVRYSKLEKADILEMTVKHLRHIQRHRMAGNGRTHARTHARTPARTHARTHARPNARTHACKHARTHSPKHANMQASTRMHTRTQTHKSAHCLHCLMLMFIYVLLKSPIGMLLSSWLDRTKS